MHTAVRYAITGILVLGLGLQARLVYATPQFTPKWTVVEAKFLAASKRQSSYPNEHIAVIETANQYELGRLTALRFIEWAISNPNGVIALASGSTPEYFIKFLHHYKQNWHKPHVLAELHSFGINRKNFPDTTNMKFVQLEEYFPISPKHTKNVSNYIKRHYIKLLGLKKHNILLMNLTSNGVLAEKGLKVVFMNGKLDLSIMQRKASSQLDMWQQLAIRDAMTFCTEYERKIRAWGGIDFFVGSLGYGGDLGFNKPGVDIDNKTHIEKLDYRSAAHAAKDLGGIEHSIGKVAVTIGLGTITFKPNATMIVIASGEAKAPMVRDAVQNTINAQFPATILQKYSNSKFYVAAGAAKLLRDRHNEDLRNRSKNGWGLQLLEEVIIDIALAEKKQIVALTEADLRKYAMGIHLLQTLPKSLPELLQDIRQTVISKIENGLNLDKLDARRILHTAPHHDDIMLGYYSIIDQLLKKYQNNFVYVTSGFNSVPDSYILNTLGRASDWWLSKESDLIFNKSYAHVIGKFRNHFIKHDQVQMNLLDTTIALKLLVNIYDLKDVGQLKQTIRWLKDDYFPNKLPGDIDVASIKMLKGMIRESEVDRKWSLKNIPLANIVHLRSKFYTGKEFMTTPRAESDVLPFVRAFNKINPDILTVEDDPNSAPPVTHYKALQIVAHALQLKETTPNSKLKIWGYRNIWFQYKLYEANIFVPVEQAMLDGQTRVCKACFNTQKSASFPSPFFEGDFASLTSMIQKDQLADLKILLGAEYFSNHSEKKIKNAVGFVYLKQMTIQEFLQQAEDLQLPIALEENFEVLSS